MTEQEQEVVMTRQELAEAYSDLEPRKEDPNENY